VIGPLTVLDEESSNNLEFPLGVKDTLFVLTKNNSTYKEGLNNLISKMVVLDGISYIRLYKMAELLDYMHIEKLNIFCIDNDLDNKTINYAHVNIGSDVRYTEMNVDNFLVFINSEREF
jgi:hypothetical protein